MTGELIPVPTKEAAAATERAIIAELEAILSTDKRSFTSAATERAIIAELEAAQTKRKVEQLAERLRQLVVNPNELDELLWLKEYFFIRRIIFCF